MGGILKKWSPNDSCWWNSMQWEYHYIHIIPETNIASPCTTKNRTQKRVKQFPFWYPALGGVFHPAWIQSVVIMENYKQTCLGSPFQTRQLLWGNKNATEKTPAPRVIFDQSRFPSHPWWMLKYRKSIRWAEVFWLEQNYPEFTLDETPPLCACGICGLVLAAYLNLSSND